MKVGVCEAPELKKQGEKLQKAGFPVLHFYTMTRTEQVQQIIKELI